MKKTLYLQLKDIYDNDTHIDRTDHLRMHLKARSRGNHELASWLLLNKELYKLLCRTNFKVRDVS
jgi:hypothetical protein